MRATALSVACCAWLARGSPFNRYSSFGKWTLASKSAEHVDENTWMAWFALNHRELERNASIDAGRFALVGPTGCDGVHRGWSAARYDIGDNEYHFVRDASARGATGDAAASANGSSGSTQHHKSWASSTS